MNDSKNFFKVALLASLGSGLEYYDFVIYGMMVKYIGDIFFPNHLEFISIMQAFSVFAVGYLIRPVGGVIFGMIADSYGRKKSFILVMLTMALSTLAIGLLPTYEQAGIIAPILLVICRLFQGVSFGAELPGAATIVSEFAPKGRLGRLSSLVLSSTSLGSLLAVFTLSMLASNFTYVEITNNIWRIPFIIGGVLAVISFYIRNNITETPEFMAARRRQTGTQAGQPGVLTPLKLILSENMANIAIGFGLSFFLATLVIMNLYFPVYISKYFNYNLPDIYHAMTISMMASFILILFFGVISDYVSKFNMMLLTLTLCAASLPFSYELLSRGGEGDLQIFFIIHQIWIASFFTSYIPILPRLFTTNVRYTGVALSYNIAFSMASLIPVICAYFFQEQESPFFLVGFIIIAIAMAMAAIIALIFRGKGEYSY